MINCFDNVKKVVMKSLNGKAIVLFNNPKWETEGCVSSFTFDIPKIGVIDSVEVMTCDYIRINLSLKERNEVGEYCINKKTALFVTLNEVCCLLDGLLNKENNYFVVSPKGTKLGEVKQWFTKKVGDNLWEMDFRKTMEII